MAELSDARVVAEQTERDLERLSGADLVVGVASYNSAETIDGVIAACRAGFAGHFPGARAVIVHADGGSKDGTLERARQAAEGDPFLQVPYSIHPIDRLSDDLTSMPGKASAHQTIFSVAQKIGAKVCIVLSGAVRGVTPDRIERLASPILEQEFDFVAPYYRRHKLDGGIGKGILDPMTRALYGKRIRQAGPSEFGVSGRFADRCLAKETWNTDISSACGDLWLQLQALSGGFRICQTFLGTKVEHGGGSAPDLSTILSQLLGCLFGNMIDNAAIWQKTRGSEPVPVFGPPFESATEPAAVNLKRMVEAYRLGHRDLQGIWSMVLPPATLLELKKLAVRPDEQFRLEDQVWARTLFDFSLAYRLRTIGRDHLLRAFTPLYLGWAASFIRQIQEAGSEDVERHAEELCVTIESQKPYLISRWRWPDRFNP
ncbi:MAG: glycosyl transferase family 2 [Candidatus Solibacter sp.]